MTLLKTDNIKEEITVSDMDIVSMADGVLCDIADVGDPVFSQSIMGESAAFSYEDDKVILCSPANGILSLLYPNGHAFGITMKDETELLIHIGVDTNEAKGEGFTLLGKKQGDTVKAGDPIIEVDMEKLSKIYDMPVMLIVTNSKDHPVKFIGPCTVKKGQKINV